MDPSGKTCAVSSGNLLKRIPLLLPVVTLVVFAAIGLRAHHRFNALTSALGLPLTESSLGIASSQMDRLPRTVLWAWERPEDLTFLDTQEVGVAFLATTLALSGERVAERPRLQPLRISPGTSLVAVARIETDHAMRPLLSQSQRDETVRRLADLARRPGIAALQIDFDALKSEREFYRALLVDLRREMPGSMPLSITALASWCIDDDWLHDLPVDEAVPMLFRLGVDVRQVRGYLTAGGRFQNSLCKESAGISMDEPVPPVLDGRRLYVFNPRPWTAPAVRRIPRGGP